MNAVAFSFFGVVMSFLGKVILFAGCDRELSEPFLFDRTSVVLGSAATLIAFLSGATGLAAT
jgi:hypothetical protein